MSEQTIPLMPYRVTLHEDEGDKCTLVYDCHATCDDHAIGQAEAAYPGCEIINCLPFSDDQKTYLVFASSEFVASDGGGFWCDDTGWVRIGDATRYAAGANIHGGVLPLSRGGDAMLVLLEEALTFAKAPGSTLLEVDLQTVVGGYDTPDQVPEWRWIEQNASYRHCRNGEDGVWEFILVLSRTFEWIPLRLKTSIARARASGHGYLLFHQGT